MWYDLLSLVGVTTSLISPPSSFFTILAISDTLLFSHPALKISPFTSSFICHY